MTLDDLLRRLEVFERSGNHWIHFPRGEIEHSGFPPDVNFLKYLYHKISFCGILYLMLMLRLFLHSILFEIVYNLLFWDTCTDDWYVNKYISIWYRPTLILCPIISKSNSSVVESWSRNPWIGVNLQSI